MTPRHDLQREMESSEIRENNNLTRIFAETGDPTNRDNKPGAPGDLTVNPQGDD